MIKLSIGDKHFSINTEWEQKVSDYMLTRNFLNALSYFFSDYHKMQDQIISLHKQLNELKGNIPSEYWPLFKEPISNREDK
ncbi:MAG TPA: hypothetical protein PKI46_00610 [Bacteroidales bacterium]|nr:hypothetical protein [Bacteroidales bacterium]